MPAKIHTWLSNRVPARGETVTVKAMVMHPMETGMRKNALSELIPRNIIAHFECTLAGETLLSWHLDTAVSQNPYLEFRFIAQRPGELRLVWAAEDGQVFEKTEHIEIA